MLLPELVFLLPSLLVVSAQRSFLPPPPPFRDPASSSFFPNLLQQGPRTPLRSRQSGGFGASAADTRPQSPGSQSGVGNEVQPNFVLHDSLMELGFDIHRLMTSGEARGRCAPPAEFYRKVENAAHSPLSVAAALAVLMRGAEGLTEQELRTVLNFPPEARENYLMRLFKFRLEKLLEAGRGVDVEFSSTLFGAPELRLIKAFFNDTQEFYNTSVLGVDYGNPDEAMAGINRWVRRQTKGKIENILTFPPDPDTKLMLVNTLYFNGAWESPFQRANTRFRTFTVNPGDTVQVPMMNQLMELPYAKSEVIGAEMIGLPYKGTEFGLFLVLPMEPHLAGLENLEDVLDQETFDRLLFSMSAQEVSVTMPSFKLSSRTNLATILLGIGVCNLFNPETPELTRVSSNDKRLYVSDMYHQANIVVNEEGTEAAAATVTSATRATARKFRANRPFLFVLRDNETGIPLFIGRVVRPSSN